VNHAVARSVIKVKTRGEYERKGGPYAVSSRYLTVEPKRRDKGGKRNSTLLIKKSTVAQPEGAGERKERGGRGRSQHHGN